MGGSMDHNEYVSIKDIAESDDYPFTMGQMRHFLMMRHKNGLQTAIRKIGKRLYLRRDLFDDWIESQSSRGGHL